MRVLLRPGVLLGIALVSLLLTVTSLGLVAWIAADPQRWVPDAFAERGEQGPPGPQGPRGPAGPPGPVGPDAEDAIFSLQSDVDDLSIRVDDLESGTSGTDLQSQLDELDSKLGGLCDAINNAYLTSDVGALGDAFFDIYNEAC